MESSQRSDINPHTSEKPKDQSEHSQGTGKYLGKDAGGNRARGNGQNEVRAVLTVTSHLQMPPWKRSSQTDASVSHLEKLEREE